MRPFALLLAAAIVAAVSCPALGQVVLYETAPAVVTYQAGPTIVEPAPVYYYAVPTIAAPRVYGGGPVIFGPTLAPAPPIYRRPLVPRLWLYRWGF